MSDIDFQKQNSPLQLLTCTPLSVDRTKLPAIVCCDPQATGSISYELIRLPASAHHYTMQTNQVQVVKETGWKLQYRPTPTSPTITHNLENGTFHQFRRIKTGWRLFRISDNDQ